MKPIVIDTSKFKPLSPDQIDYCLMLTKEKVKNMTKVSIPELVMIDINNSLGGWTR